MRNRVGIAIVLAFATAVSAASLQQPPTFRASTSIVQLDVTVLDKDRRPILGLKPEDFTILEDGKPQQIAAFHAIDLPDIVTTPVASGWKRDVAPDVATNSVADARLFVIVMDDATIQNDPAAVEAAKKVARSVVDKLGPSDLTSVILPRDNRATQDFTRDRAKLLAAIDSFSVGFRDMGKNGRGQDIVGDDLFFKYSVNVLDQIADFLIALPDRRKTLVYVGQGVPIDNGASSAAKATTARETQLILIEQMKDIFRRAAQANVNVYTYDACGLRPPPSTQIKGHPCEATPAGLQEIEYLQTVAENTGGRATVNTNDYEPAVTQMFRENNSYYLIGYTPANMKADGTFRRIEVTVNRADAEVRTRKNYYAPLPDAENAAKKKAAESPASTAISGLLPAMDVSLRVTAAPFALAGGKAAVALALGVERPGRIRADDVDVVVNAFTPEGKAVGSVRQSAHLTSAAGAGDVTVSDLLARLDLPPGRYELRMSAHSASLDKNGSVYADLVVPDFAKEPLSLSGMVLSATPGLSAAPKDAFATLLPVVPTSQREFYRSDRVTAMVRAYQGGKAAASPVSLTVRVLDDQGAAKFDATETLAADQFTTDRAADYQLDVPLAKLARGEYLLTIEATMGKNTVRRDVRFSVK